MSETIRELFTRLEAWWDLQCPIPKRPLRYGVRMSVLVLAEDEVEDVRGPFQHPTEPCSGCNRLVIGSAARGPIVCEECLGAIIRNTKAMPA